MSTRLMVDGQNELQEVRENDLPQQSSGLRVFAKIISVLFHPVFVPLYMVAFLLYGDPNLFAGFDKWGKTKVLIMAFEMFTFFPIVTVLLLKGLRFIASIQLKTQKDRIIPYVACGIWYFWIWYIWRTLPDYPTESIMLTLSAWIAVSLALLVNIYMKISMHSISMGGLVAFFFILAFREEKGYGFYISVALFVAGLVCTARMIVSDHTQKEIYTGLGVGALSMWIASWIW